MNEVYSWSENITDEIWSHGKFNSVEECVKDAKAEGKKPGETIAVGICNEYVPSIDVGLLLDSVSEEAYDQCGEIAEGWLEFIDRKGYKDEDKLQAAIDKVFHEWLKETNQVPSFYNICPFADLVTIPEEVSE